ncbi:MAG: hypothetical protein V5A33_02250 [Halobacteriales archaeon]
MTKKTIAVVAVALAALVALSGLVAAGYGPGSSTAADESNAQADWDEDTVDAMLDRLQERYDLTDEQVSELRETIESKLEADAGPLEIRDAVIEQLEAFGIDDPQVGPPEDAGARNDTAPAPAFDRLQERYDLTDEQVTDLRETVESMVDEGANRSEIHDAIVEKLESFGVEDPELGPQAAWSNGDAAGAPWGLFGFGPHANGQGGGHGHGPGSGPHGNGAGNGHGGNGNATAGGGPGQGLGPGNGAGGR